MAVELTIEIKNRSHFCAIGELHFFFSEQLLQLQIKWFPNFLWFLFDDTENINKFENWKCIHDEKHNKPHCLFTTYRKPQCVPFPRQYPQENDNYEPECFRNHIECRSHHEMSVAKVLRFGNKLGDAYLAHRAKSSPIRHMCGILIVNYAR